MGVGVGAGPAGSGLTGLGLWLEPRGPVTGRLLSASLGRPCACLPSGDVSIGIKCAPGVVGPAEADIDFDIIKNDNDTFTVKYTPPGAGRYTIMVLFANQVHRPRPLAGIRGLYPAPRSQLAAWGAVVGDGGVGGQLHSHWLSFACVWAACLGGNTGAVSEAAVARPDQAFPSPRRSPPAPSTSRWIRPTMPARSRRRALG